MSLLGERLVELRSIKKLSRTQLADVVGLSYSQIGRYEKKGVQPPDD